MLELQLQRFPHRVFGNPSLFSQSEFPEKGMVYRNWISQVMLLEEKCNLVFVFLRKFRLRGQTQGFQNLYRGVSFCVCWISLQP